MLGNMFNVKRGGNSDKKDSLTEFVNGLLGNTDAKVTIKIDVNKSKNARDINGEMYTQDMTDMIPSREQQVLQELTGMGSQGPMGANSGNNMLLMALLSQMLQPQPPINRNMMSSDLLQPNALNQPQTPSIMDLLSMAQMGSSPLGAGAMSPGMGMPPAPAGMPPAPAGMPPAPAGMPPAPAGMPPMPPELAGMTPEQAGAAGAAAGAASVGGGAMPPGMPPMPTGTEGGGMPPIDPAIMQQLLQSMGMG